MSRIITPAIVLAAVCAVVWAVVGSVTSHTPTAMHAHQQAHDSMTEYQQAHYATFTTPCETDDQIGCVWVADTMGDTNGTSYWADLDGIIVPLSHDDARTLLSTGELP